MASDAGGVTLADPPAFVVAAGTLALLTEGCDKRMATCSARFGNAANFRGEPYLPGNDLLTRYPGG
uniref:phage BR0599 family protein n=1 Tax=Sphingobium phenoxybenzoativorans TaxID=1592790 RepID=UPI0008727360|nr:phage BR0599 family protein [Sphingobium phenoxybenzoativorans]